jgi:hypothetical protein
LTQKLGAGAVVRGLELELVDGARSWGFYFNPPYPSFYFKDLLGLLGAFWGWGFLLQMYIQTGLLL